jgi:hypothetical protein
MYISVIKDNLLLYTYLYQYVYVYIDMSAIFIGAY